VRIARLLALALAAATPLLPAAERKPNVVLILADDLGFRDLGCYGHPSIRTPVLDQLAAGGTRLTGFHSGATVCTPSRMALLTGAYPVRLGWTEGVAGYRMGMHDGMNPEALTLAEIFASEGYATAVSGKWHIGDQAGTRPPAQGFADAFYLTHSNNQVKTLWRGDAATDEPFDNRQLTRRFTEEAVRFVKANRDKPFFLYLPYTAPHFPVQPHPDWKGRSGFGDYGDVVEEMDARIGELLDTIRELGLEKETIVVFTSDNGPQKGEAADAYPFRGAKWSALEGGTRVPCVVSWPGVIPAGKVGDQLFGAIDLLPTLCRACGIDWKSKSSGKPVIDGLDLWDSLLGKQDAARRAELLHWHGMHAEPQAIRSGEWKLFFKRGDALTGPGTDLSTADQAAKLAPYRDALGRDDSPFLVRPGDDPGETVDLSAKFPAQVETLTARAAEIMAGIKAAPVLPVSKPQASK
jgi:arylsulfatase A-like enzyme